MQTNEFVKGTYTKKDGKELVISDTHVLNAVALLALGFLIFEGFSWWKTGVQPDLVTLLCLLPVTLMGATNLRNYLSRK